MIQASDESPPQADTPSNRREFLSASSLAMAGGLAASYGTLAVMAGRYLYPAEGIAKAWLFVTEVDAVEPPFARATLHNKLSITLNNSLRYLRALEAQYQIAAARAEQLEINDDLAGEEYGREMNELLRGIVTGQAAYQVDPREILMKRQYERLYAEVRAELGMELLNF